MRDQPDAGEGSEEVPERYDARGEGKDAAAGKLIALMSMGVKQGDEVTVQVEGPDEDAAFEALEKFFQENL